MNPYMAAYIANINRPQRLQPGEAELIISKRCGEKVWELLRAYHTAAWTDKQGYDHVIIGESRIGEIIAARQAEKEAE